MKQKARYKCLRDPDTGEEFYVNEATGEVFDPGDNAFFVTKVSDAEERAKRQRRWEAYQKKLCKQTDVPDFGAFAWHVYSMTKENFPDLNDAAITRLMYLVSRSTYDGRVLTRNRKSATRANLQELLMISRQQTTRFFNVVTNGGYLEVADNGELYINKDIFMRGDMTPAKIAKLAQDDKYIMRLYFPIVRYLYESADPLTRGVLSHMYKLLPFMNREYNIICHNPLETDIDKVEKMRMGEFCDAIGYDKTHSGRLANILFKPEFKVGDHTEGAVAYVANKSLRPQDFCIYVNPRIFYAGNHANSVKVLGAFF